MPSGRQMSWVCTRMSSSGSNSVTNGDPSGASRRSPAGWPRSARGVKRAPQRGVLDHPVVAEAGPDRGPEHDPQPRLGKVRCAATSRTLHPLQRLAAPTQRRGATRGGRPTRSARRRCAARRCRCPWRVTYPLRHVRQIICLIWHRDHHGQASNLGILLFVAYRALEQRALDAVVAAGITDITLAQARIAARIGPHGTASPTWPNRPASPSRAPGSWSSSSRRPGTSSACPTPPTAAPDWSG